MPLISNKDLEYQYLLLLGEKIKDFRRQQGLTQAKLSSSLGVSRTSITNIEIGQQRTSVFLLARIAQELQEPELFTIPQLTEAQEALKSTQQIPLAEANKLLEGALEMHGITPITPQKITEVLMTSLEKIAEKAESLLKHADAWVIPIDLKKLLSHLQLTIDERALEEEYSGLLIAGKNPAVIVVNSSHPKNRRRFTVAHEIGHYMLHAGKKDAHPVFIDRAEVYFRSGAQESDDYDSVKEMEANAFAANILMPKQLLEGYIEENDLDISKKSEIKALAQEFEVSQQAMEYRLRNVGLIMRME